MRAWGWGWLGGWLLSWIGMGGVAQPPPITLAQTSPGQSAYYTELQAASDGSGGSVLAFRRTPAGGTAQLVLQRLTASGARQWPEEGVLLTPPEVAPGPHRLLPDGEGGAFVVWEEHRNGQAVVRAQRVGPQGQLLWGPQGVRVSTAAVGQYAPVLVTDYQGGIIVCWEQATATERDLYAQRLNSAGRNLFPPTGMPICRAPGIQRHLQLEVSPGQGIVVLWEDFRAGSQWLLYAQQLDLAGRPIWATDGISLAPGRNLTQRWPSIFTDGFGGLFCVYEALGGLNIDKDIYIVRVNRGGRVVYQSPVCAVSGDQTRPHVRKRGSEAWIVWEDWRSGNADIWVQVVDVLTGALRLEPNGRPVLVAPGTQQAPRLEFGAVGGEPIVVWEEERANAIRLQAQRLNSQVQRVWAPTGVTLAAGLGNPGVYTVASNDNGGCWAVWVGSASGGSDLPRAQQVDQQGRLQFAPEGLAVQPAPSANIAPFGHISAAAEAIGTGAYVAWEDNRGSGGSDIYLQRLDGQGRPRWRAGGIPICAAPGRQSLPVLAPVPGGVFVGWIDRRSNEDNLFIQYVDSSGMTRLRPDGNSLCLAPGSQNSLRLLALGPEQVLAVWVDSRNLRARGFDLYAQRVNRQGQVAWQMDGRPLQNTGGFQTSPILIPDPVLPNGATVAWSEERGGSYNLVVQRLTPEGMPAAPLQVVEPTREQQRYPAAATGGQGEMWLAWTQAPAGAEASALRIQAFSRYHVPQFPNGRSLGLSGTGTGLTAEAPQWAAVSQGLALAWLGGGARLGSDRNLYLQILNRDGSLRLPGSGLQLAQGLDENAPFRVQGLGSLLAVAWPTGAPEMQRVHWLLLEVTNGRVRRQHQPAANPGAAQLHPWLVPLGAGRVGLCWAENNLKSGSCHLRFQVLE